ncbi:GGDEF domain-containing protein [Salipiger bermudensis]|uniref:GGDEF domain-containing protein n=1 Tax=Salipiger bermudensis TaxID=344736 RepID=UPI001C999FAF|nr:GGDEF domain-containing protein [Salipiger bermudensis]MBY6005782.1 GGDEF domain-containing protein [Salipiger bermudensis]
MSVVRSAAFTFQRGSARAATAPVSHTTLRGVVWIRWAALSVVAFLCIMAIEGHVYAIPGLYAPVGAAVFSIPTVLAALLALAATSMQAPLRTVSRLEAALWGMVIAVSVGAQILHAQGLNFGAGQMGENTSLSFILLALGQLSFGRLRQAPLGLTLLAMALPFIGLCGYLFEQPQMFGAMSLPTSVMLLGLSTAGLLRFVRRPLLRSTIGNSPVGRAARRLLLLWFGWLGASAVLMKIIEPAFQSLTMFFVMVLSSVGVFMLVLYLAMLAEARHKRYAHRKDALAQALLRDPDSGLYGPEMARLFMATFGGAAPMGIVLVGFEAAEGDRDRMSDDARIAALRELAANLGAVLCAEEILTLSADDRLTILIRGIAGDEIEARAGRLLNAARGLERSLPGVTVSMGAACSRRGDTAFGPALTRAEGALREAERAGCNRVVLARAA